MTAEEDASQNQRLFLLESQMNETRADQTSMHEQLARNTAAIHAVKCDTEQLITLLKGSKIFAQVLKWAVSIAAACAAIWATIKGAR